MAQKYFFTTDYSDSGNPIESSLKQFSEQQIDTIINRYLNQKSFTEIRKEFPGISNQAFERQLPFILSEETCEKCGEEVYYDYKRKATKEGGYAIESKLCASCLHNQTELCACPACELEYKEEQERKEAIFSEVWKEHLEEEYPNKIELKEIDTHTEVQLYCITKRFSVNDKYLDFNKPDSIYRFVGEKGDKIDFFNFTDIIRNITSRQIVIPSVHCDSRVAVIKGDDVYLEKPEDITLADYLWDLNIYKDGRKIRPSEFINYMENVRDFSNEEKYYFWREIYKFEVVKYLNHLTNGENKLQFEMPIYDYITDTLIKHYSPSKAYSIISIAFHGVNRYRKRISSKAKIDAFFKNEILELAEEYKDGKSLKGHNRIKDIPLYVEDEFALKHILGGIENSYFHCNTNLILPSFDQRTIDI